MARRASARKGVSSSVLRRRTALVALLFLAGFLVLAYRCLHLHLADDPKLSRIARSQYQTRIPEAAPRGRIVDRKGEELAITVPTVSLAVRPRKVSDRKAALASLHRALDIPVSTLREKLDSDRPYVWLKRHLSPAEARWAESRESPGLEVVKESKRFYPNRELGSQVLGAVGWDGEGLGGLELAYDRFLRGAAGEEWGTRDARGQFLDTGRDRLEEGTHNLVLTLSEAIQYVTEAELAAACEERKARSCSAVVMEPQTGAILAMASVPTFNPNAYGTYDLSHWRNRSVTDTFEPGSIFKPIIAAVALESGSVGPNDRFFCENGALRVGKHVINDHHQHGLMTLPEIMKVSSNIGFYKIGSRVGKKSIFEGIRDFGFGAPTGIDYPGEVGGLLSPAGEWGEIRFANVTFGQGVGVTPLQMAQAYAVLANDGLWVKPHLVSRITDGSGRTVRRTEAGEGRRVLRAETARAIRGLMVGVTEEGGTGRLAEIPGYPVAGKTGTSQKVENGRYSHSKFVASFAGMVPADDPRVVVLIVIDEPQGLYYGGQVAAPVFRRVAWAALRELGVPPAERTPAPPEPMVREAGLFSLPHRPETGVMPDLRGLSKREALLLLELTGLPVEMEGSGVVVRQEPSPGTNLKGRKECRITLSAGL